MSSVVIQEFLIGVVGGLLTVPAYYLIWPLLTVISTHTVDQLGYGFATSLIGFVWLFLAALAVIGIPMLASSWLFAKWSFTGMETNATLIAGRTHSAAATVYFMGFVAGIGALTPLRRLAVVRRAQQRWERWMERLDDGHR